MRRACGLALVSLLSGCIAMTPKQEAAYVRAMSSERHPSVYDIQSQPYDPDVALGLSFVLPGAGHLYLNESVRAIGWFILSAFFPGCAPIAAWADARELDRIAVAEDQLRREGEITTWSCRQCGQESQVGAVRCPRCGTKREVPR